MNSSKWESLKSSSRASNSKPGGVQKLYTILRHRIGDNFNAGHASSDKTSKDNEEIVPRSVNVVCKVPSGDRVIDSSFKRTHGIFKPQRFSNMRKTDGKSVPKQTAHSSKKATMMSQAVNARIITPSPETTPTAPTALLSNSMPTAVYVDSDDEYQFEVSTASTLEDEIFEELERAAHDEAKLYNVLQNFDSIFSEYNCCGFGTAKVQLPPRSQEETATEKKPDQELNNTLLTDQKCTKVMPKLERRKSCSLLETRSCTRLLTSRPTFKHFKSLDNICIESKPNNGNPFSEKHHRIINRQENKAEAPRSGHHSKSTWELGTAVNGVSKIPIRVRSNSSCDLTVTAVGTATSTYSAQRYPHPPPRMRKGLKKDSSNSKTERNTAELTPSIKPHSSKMYSSHATSSVSAILRAPIPKFLPKPMCATKTISRISVGREKHSDILLYKCLAKGHEILRKVENMQSVTRGEARDKNSHNKSSHLLAQTAGKSLTFKKITNLHYANDIIQNPPLLESCKVIPPIIGDISVEHSKLLVNVVQVKPKDKQISTLENFEKQINGENHTMLSENVTPALAIETNGNANNIESDDSGHISNDNFNEYLNNNETECGKSLKVADLLRKFENPRKMYETIGCVAVRKAFLPQKSSCKTVKVANVEAIQCVKTQIEIYPTYSKEVTIRLI